MKKRFAVLPILFCFALTACAGLQTVQSRTETIVISYESIATIGFPTVLAYLRQREANGSLAGQELADAKAKYALARQTFIQAGDVLKQYIQGQDPNLLASFPLLLRQVATMLADLGGGSVQGNNLTVPAAGGGVK